MRRTFILKGKCSVQKGTHITLSANTITRKIDKRAEDIEAVRGMKLSEKIPKSLWHASKVDKSTNVDSKTAILVFM